MPHSIPGLTINWNTCLAGADETTKKQFAAIRDLFHSLKDIEEKDCEKYFFKPYIEQGRFNFYLVGGRATFLLLKALHHQGSLKGPFWEKFDWTSFESRLAKDNDFDIQFAFNDKARIWFPYDLNLFKFMKSVSFKINGSPVEIKGVDKHHMSCHNNTIDVATQNKNIDSLDFTNTSIRINLITGEVTCFSKEGLDLLIYHHTVDMPDLGKYMVPSKRKDRADFSKIVFMLRNFEKYMSSHFVLSETNAAVLSTKLNMDYGKFKIYLEKKIHRLKYVNGDSKTALLEKSLGNNSECWIQNLVSLSDKNKADNVAKSTLSPMSTLADILSTMTKIKTLHQSDSVKKSNMEFFVTDVLATCSRLDENNLNAIAANLTGYASSLSIVNKKIQKAQKETLANKMQSQDAKNLKLPSTPAIATWYPSIQPKRKFRPTVEQEKDPTEDAFTTKQLHSIIDQNEILYNQAFKMRSLNHPLPDELKKIGANLGETGHPPLANPKNAYAHATNIFFIAIVVMTIFYCYSTTAEKRDDFPDANTQLACFVMAVIAIVMGFFSYSKALLPSPEARAQMGLEHSLELLHTQFLDKNKKALDLRPSLALVLYNGLLLRVYAKDENIIRELVSTQFEKNTECFFSLIHTIFTLEALPDKKYQFICDISNALTTLDKKNVFHVLEYDQFAFDHETTREDMEAAFQTHASEKKDRSLQNRIY